MIEVRGGALLYIISLHLFREEEEPEEGLDSLGVCSTHAWLGPGGIAIIVVTGALNRGF